MMKKGELLKTVVIVQAVCMIVLTGLVVVKMWPILGAGGPGSIASDDGDDVGGGGFGGGAPGDDGNGAGRGGNGGGNGASGGDGNGGQPGAGGGSGRPGAGGGAVDGQAVASVGGVPITRDELTSELYAAYGDAVLRSIMVRKAIELEAAAAGLEATAGELDKAIAKAAEGYGGIEPYYEAMRQQLGMSRSQVREELRYRLLLEAIAMKGEEPVSDADVEAYIAEHAELYAPQVQLHLQWIVTATREQAEDLLQRLEQGESFAALARSYSMDEHTAASGGDLGFVRADDPFYDAAVLAAAGSLGVGDIAGPVALQSGYAIVRLSGRKTNAGLPRGELEEEVRRQLALERAKPLVEVEEDLLKRYGAVVQK